MMFKFYNNKIIIFSGVMEAYEKAIAELISEKEQIGKNYENKCAELISARDLNFQHLTSLETTFSDLNAKYERSKQKTIALLEAKEMLIKEKQQNFENLRQQEQRYEKLKGHAMAQLEMLVLFLVLNTPPCMS